MDYKKVKNVIIEALNFIYVVQGGHRWVGRLMVNHVRTFSNLIICLSFKKKLSAILRYSSYIATFKEEVLCVRGTYYQHIQFVRYVQLTRVNNSDEFDRSFAYSSLCLKSRFEWRQYIS